MWYPEQIGSNIDRSKQRLRTVNQEVWHLLWVTLYKGEINLMTYSYEEAKRLEYIDFNKSSLLVNEITIYNASKVHFHEYDHEFIGVRILDDNENEIASFTFDKDFSIFIDRQNGVIKLV